MNEKYEVSSVDEWREEILASVQRIFKSCGECVEFDIYSPGCSACQSSDISIEPDAPLLLEEIEFED